MTPKQILALRKRLGVSQAGLAQRIGVTANTVARWERGEVRPGSGYLRALREVEPRVEPSKEELGRRFDRAMRRLWAGHTEASVGGAVAMAAAGFVRETQDIDLFLREEELPSVALAMRQAGLEVFPVMAPSHFAAKIPGDPDPERRVDLLVTFSEPELSAIERGTTGHTPFGSKWYWWRVFDPTMTALVKFYAFYYSRDPRHLLDLQGMHLRGLFDEARVRAMVEHLDPDDVEEWDAAAAAWRAREAPRPRRPKRKLPPPERGEQRLADRGG